jgi:LysM domain
MRLVTRCRTLWSVLFVISWVLMAAVPVSIADDQTSSKINYEAGFYYTVKKGDTLWDLSQKFSDTPWQWPDLWHENKQLPNPHWIYPGERIRLFRKTALQRESPPTQVPAVAPQAEANAPAKESKPQVDFYYGNIDQVGFIRQQAVQPLGIISKSLGDKRLISTDDTVYIQYADSNSAKSFAPGTRMTIYRTLSPGDDDRSISYSGTQHLLTGVIEVTKKEADFAIAKVVKSYRAIRLDDMLMPYESHSTDIAVIDSTPGIDGRIIEGENHDKLLSNYYIAFINKGAEDHIRPGQIYQVYKREKAPVGPGGSMVALDPVYSGSLIVLRTEQTTSTVVITHDVQKITPGDQFQTP